MDHAVLAGSQLDKRADGQDADDLAVVQLADLRHEADIVDHLLGGVAGGGVGRRDVDGAVVVDVDLCAGFCHDLLDHGAALADDLADLVHVDLHGEHLGCILGNMVARLGDAGDHDLVQDLKAGLAAALERVGDDLHGQAVVLEVHLDGGDALGRTGNLEVHLAVEVLNALNVGEGSPRARLLVGDEAAGNTGDGTLDGHACVHQSQRGAADGGLRRGAVGGNDLGDDADGIRELVNGRDHGQQGLFGQRAVADLAAGGGAARTGFAGGPLRHIIVVDIAALGLVIDSVELLRGREGVQRADGQNLRLAAGEQAGAVDARQNADLGSQRANFVRRAAVDALALEQPLFDDLLLHLVQAHVDLDIPVFCILLAELLLEVDDSLGQTGLADVLVVGVECVGDLVQTVLAQIVEHIVVDGGLFKRELRLADGVNDGVDELHDLHVRLMGQLDALHEDVFLDLVGLRLDHDDLLVSRRDGHEALAGVALILRGVDDILAVQIADIGGRGRAVPGNVGIGDDERRADGGDDLNGVIVVLREDGVGQNDVVAQLFVEQGAHRAVDQTGDQHAAVRGLALAAVERAGDTADSVHTLFDLDGQREIVDASLGQGRGDSRDEHDGIAVAADGLCIAELCDLAGLDRKGTAADLGFKNVVIRILLVGDHERTSFVFCARGRFST